MILESIVLILYKKHLCIVQLCKALGICKAGMLIIDSTKLKANASSNRSKIKEQYEQWVERIDIDIKNILDEAEQTDKEEDKK